MARSPHHWCAPVNDEVKPAAVIATPDRTQARIGPRKTAEPAGAAGSPRRSAICQRRGRGCMGGQAPPWRQGRQQHMVAATHRAECCILIGRLHGLFVPKKGEQSPALGQKQRPAIIPLLSQRLRSPFRKGRSARTQPWHGGLPSRNGLRRRWLANGALRACKQRIMAGRCFWPRRWMPVTRFLRTQHPAAVRAATAGRHVGLILLLVLLRWPDTNLAGDFMRGFATVGFAPPCRVFAQQPSTFFTLHLSWGPS